MKWFWQKKREKDRKENDEKEKVKQKKKLELQELIKKLDTGTEVEYLGQRMTVVLWYYDGYMRGRTYIPEIMIEMQWFDKTGRLQSIEIAPCERKLMRIL